MTLPEYSLRRSGRARRASIRISHQGDVEVVIPKGFDERRIPAFVEQHAEWITRRVEHTERERASIKREPTDSLGRPLAIELRAARERWSVVYVPSDSARITVTEKAAPTTPETIRELRLTGAVNDPAACADALRRWLRGRARRHLEPRLDSLAAQHEFEFTRLTVRLQRSRWGSCSARRTISLNAKCMFLPPELVDHLLLHELCHTVQANHSPRFHELLEHHSPGTRGLREGLRSGWRYVPAWAEQS